MECNEHVWKHIQIKSKKPHSANNGKRYAKIILLFDCDSFIPPVQWIGDATSIALNARCRSNYTISFEIWSFPFRKWSIQFVYAKRSPTHATWCSNEYFRELELNNWLISLERWFLWLLLIRTRATHTNHWYYTSVWFRLDSLLFCYYLRSTPLHYQWER